MAPTLAATVADPTKSVSLTVSGALGAITVRAYPPGLPSYAVRASFANGRASVDYDVPLNTDVVYIATDAGPPATQSPQVVVRVNSSTAMLSVMTSPVQVAAVDVLADTNQTYEGASTPHKVIGTNAPLVTIEPPAYRSGRYRLRCPTIGDWLAIRAMLMTGAVMLLRSPCPTEYADTSFIMVTGNNIIGWSSQPPRVRVFELDYQATAPDTNPPADLAWTWGDVPGAAATWADAPVKWVTWADLTVYVPVP